MNALAIPTPNDLFPEQPGRVALIRAGCQIRAIAEAIRGALKETGRFWVMFFTFTRVTLRRYRQQEEVEKLPYPFTEEAVQSSQLDIEGAPIMDKLTKAFRLHPSLQEELDMNDKQFSAFTNMFHQMEKRIDKRFDAVDKRFEEMGKRIDKRFDAVDKRFEEMGKRIDNLPTEDRVRVMVSKIQSTRNVAVIGYITAIAAIVAAVKGFF